MNSLGQSNIDRYATELRKAYVQVGAVNEQTQTELDEGLHRVDVALIVLKEFGHTVTNNDDGTYTVSAGTHFNCS